MKRFSLTWKLATLGLAGTLMAGAAISLAETGGRAAPAVRPETRFVTPPDRYSAAPESRDLRALVEDLESSSPDDISSGRIGRYFTNPAVIITDGRAHQINWDRIRADRPLGDRNENDTLPDRANGRGVGIEGFENHRIDANTAVVIYTAVLPNEDGSVFHQPVCATVVRDPNGGPWRVASYTAEDAAIPGDEGNDGDPLPAPLDRPF